MCERVEDVLSGLRRIVPAIDSETLRADRAMALVDQFAEIERLAAAARTVALGRVAQTRGWQRSGASSAVAWVAQTTGSTMHAAATALQTAAYLEEQPEIREAFTAGQISEVQAAEIAAAAAADPSSARDLLTHAACESVAALRERCRDVRAAAIGDEDATERVRRSRYFRHWLERDGAIRLDARLAPDDAAPLVAAVAARAEILRADARRAGRYEAPQAHSADALCSLVDGAGAPKAIVRAVVSASALERGRTVAGETCRIEGIGPISVAVARRLAANGIVRLLETDGTDVRLISHPGRFIPAKLRSVLEARDETCAVPRCGRRWGLEIDHIVPLSEGGRTTLSNLARLCKWHHQQKTYHGYRLAGVPGARTWTGPAGDQPRRANRRDRSPPDRS